MFDNIKSLRLTLDPNDVPIANAMISGEGEVMELRNAGKNIERNHENINLFYIYDFERNSRNGGSR